MANEAVNPAYPRSPTVLLGGLAHLARMIDKVRLRYAGGIQDYHYLTTGFDKALLDLLTWMEWLLSSGCSRGGNG